MDEITRRKFIEMGGKIILVTTSFTVVGTIPGCGDDDDGYSDDGYSDDGYSDDGY